MNWTGRKASLMRIWHGKLWAAANFEDLAKYLVRRESYDIDVSEDFLF
jgi:hypothetical protein